MKDPDVPPSPASFRAGLARRWDRFQLFFLSKAGADQRNSERFDLLKKKEMETERLDRLRNPSDYQGR